MIFEKKVLSDINKCYSCLGVKIKNEDYLLFAGEGDGILKVFYGKDFNMSKLIWKGGGGTMSIVPIRNKDGCLLASRGFYSMVEAADSTIEIIRFTDGTFTHEKIAELPYLHRFGIVTATDGTDYLVAASIAGYKENKEDWSHPGHIFYAKMPRDVDKSFHLDLIQLDGNFFINHGFCTGMQNGKEMAFVSSREGVFSLSPPEREGADWSITQLINLPVSDISVFDIDDDGENEIAAILPFHGDQFKIFKKYDKDYKEIYTYPVENDFYHTVQSAIIGGEKVFVGGARKLAAQLFLLRWDKKSGTFKSELIDEGIGPSNAYVHNTDGSDILLSANRQINQAAIYYFFRGE